MKTFQPRGTYFSPCRRYRYTLWREWAGAFASPGPVDPARRDRFAQFVCLNPSTADETVNDPTVAKCILLCQRWGFAGFAMTNVFAWRSTKPPVEKFRDGSAIGDDNLAWIDAVAEEAGIIVCAWGEHASSLGRAKYLADHLRHSHARKLCTLATADGRPLINKSGNPTHPLYQRNDSTFARWGGLPE